MGLHHTLGDAQVLAYGAVVTGLADLGNFRSIRTETGRESKRGEYGEMISKPLQNAPRRRSTTGMVRQRMRRSSQME